MRCCALRDMFDFQETVDLPHEPVNNFFLLFSRPLLACLGRRPPRGRLGRAASRPYDGRLGGTAPRGT